MEIRPKETRTGLLEHSKQYSLSSFILCHLYNSFQLLMKMFLYSGYMAPEYASDGLFSVKSDVFSFGILLLEIVSGKKNRGFYHPEHDLNLIGQVSQNHYITLLTYFQTNSRLFLYVLGMETVERRQSFRIN